MESPSCLFCKSSGERPLLRRTQPRHVVCQSCGLVYQTPRPTLDEMRQFYASQYWQQDWRGIKHDAPTQASPRAQAVVEWVQNSLPANGFAIEVGCGDGGIIAHVAEKCGCEVLGIEPSTEQAVAARERLGIPIVCGDIESASPDKPADVVILSHVLEHFHDPRLALQRCGTWLAKEHLYYFSRQSLCRLIAESGFEVVRCEEPEDVVRLIARKQSSASAGHYRNEYQAVLRAKRFHAVAFWPWYAARRVRSRLSGS